MTTYDDKVTARRERLLAGAQRASAASNNAYAAARRTLDVIPFGQPILVGHHSERRHRRDLARVDRNMSRSVEEAAHAKELRRRAEAVGTAGVSSDDPEAVVKLRVQLAEVEAYGVQANRWNAELRKRSKATSARLGRELTVADHVALLAEIANIGAPGVIVRALLAHANAFPWLPQIPSDAANARRIRARIAELESRAQATERRLECPDGTVIEENKAANRCQIALPGKPAEEVCKALHSAGFKWARTLGVWQRHMSNGAWHAACRVLGVPHA